MLNSEFETIKKSDQVQIDRIKVINGWLMLVTKEANTSSCYVPDRNHEWLKEKELKNREEIKLMDKLFISIDSLSLSPHLNKVLQLAGFYYIGDIVCHSDWIANKSFEKLLVLPKFGKKAYNELISFLNELGFYEPFENKDYWKLRNKK